MTSRPLVNCIIPTQDRPELLRRALNSVLNQTYENIEVIIVASPPHNPIRRLLERDELDNKRVNAIYIPEEPISKVGMNVARNVGIQKSSGEYIAFLDDDDIWNPTKLQRQIPYLDSYSIVSCLVTGVFKNHTYDKKLPDGVDNIVDINTAFHNYSILIPSCVVFRTAELQNVGGFDESIRFGELWDVSMKILEHFDPCYILDQHLVGFDREHDKDRISEFNGTENLDQAFQVYRRHKNKVCSRTERETWLKLKFAYYHQVQGIEKYKYLLSGIRRDYELNYLKNEIKTNIQKMLSDINWR